MGGLAGVRFRARSTNGCCLHAVVDRIERLMKSNSGHSGRSAETTVRFIRIDTVELIIRMFKLRSAQRCLDRPHLRSSFMTFRSWLFFFFCREKPQIRGSHRSRQLVRPLQCCANSTTRSKYASLLSELLLARQGRTARESVRASASRGRAPREPAGGNPRSESRPD